MQKLFSYGTLQLESVQIDTFNHKLKGLKDTLVGYIISELEITDEDVIKASGSNVHPVIYFTGNDADVIDGMVFEVTMEELLQADEYEVDDYKRVDAKMLSGDMAWIYAAADA